jgi:O-acetyl-ADP-ribose deacetylase (regulator of RNase III)
MPIIKTIKGNVLEAKEPFIAHGVNCIGVMGAGVALELAKKWPSSELKYREYCFKASAHPEQLLGRSLASYEKEQHKMIFHVFSQVGIGVNKRQVNYGAIARAFCTINDDLKLMRERDIIATQEKWELDKEKFKADGLSVEPDKPALPPLPTLAIPRIGARLGGGHWPIIEEIIHQCTPDVAIVVYVQ